MPTIRDFSGFKYNLFDNLLTHLIQFDKAVLPNNQLLGLGKQTLLTLKEQVFPVVFVLPIHKTLTQQTYQNFTSPQLITVHAMRILAET
jgi:hypothetical protein